MSKSESNLTGKHDENLLSTLIPIVVSAIVAIGCSVVYDKFVRADNSQAVSSPVLILSLDEWVAQIPSGATEEQVDQVFREARQTAEAAAKAGYIVMPENSVISAASHLRLKPGMFPIAEVSQ